MRNMIQIFRLDLIVMFFFFSVQVFPAEEGLPESVKKIIWQAGNTEQEMHRFELLGQLQKRTDLPDSLRTDLDSLVAAIGRWHFHPNRYYFRPNKEFRYAMHHSSPLFPIMSFYRGRQLVQHTIGAGGTWGGGWVNIDTARYYFQFKGIYITPHGVRDKKTCDTFYHTRVTHPLFLLWLRTGSQSLNNLLTRWLDTWIDAAERTERDKPAGILPSASLWPEGLVGGETNEWWNPLVWQNSPVNYYSFPSQLKPMCNTLLLTFYMTGEFTFKGRQSRINFTLPAKALCTLTIEKK